MVIPRSGPERPPSTFGELLRQYRLDAAMAQQMLAERAGLSVETISALERGTRRRPYLQTIGVLAEALGLSAADRAELERAAFRRVSLPDSDEGSASAAGLPISLTTFVGREAELGEIAALVREHRLVTITGTGGIGKTQTALRAAGVFGDEARSSVRFVGLATVTNPSLVADAVMSAAGAQELPDRSTLETLLAYLKNKRLLLIFDNCEHVIEEAAVVAEALLTSCPHVRILATSREPLRAAGERTYRLASMNDAEATVLFEDRARAVDDRFRLVSENALSIAELCRRLDGIPLAIELAAARANLLSVDELIERLDDRFRILAGGKRTALPRQQTMRAAIDWSYDLLSASERRLFERLSVFVSGCTLAAAETVTPDTKLHAADVFDLLSSLAEKSLVVFDLDAGDTRYRLLESTRAFAAEKLAERGERNDLARRHALWIADLADLVTARSIGMPIETWVREFEPELDNARFAIEWAMESGEIALAVRIGCGFSALWRMSRGHAEPRRWLERLLLKIDSSTQPSAVARVWHTLSTLTFGARCVEAAERALKLDTGDDLEMKLVTLHQMASALLQIGRVDAAEAANERALRLCRESGLDRSRRYAAALGIRAHIATVRDRLDAAQWFYGEALSLVKALGDATEASIFQTAIAELEYRANNVHRALEFAGAAVDAARRARSRPREAIALINSAAYRLTLGDVDAARDDARAALALARWASPVEVVAAIQHLATVEALRGDVRRAARFLGYVDAWYRDEGCERDVTERRTLEILQSALRERLTIDMLEALHAEGAQLSDEQVLREV